MKQLITQENFTSVQEAQAGLTKLFQRAARHSGFYRVLRNNKSLGVLIPDNVWEDFLEDLEALSSQKYLESIKLARSSKKSYTRSEIKRKLGI